MKPLKYYFQKVLHPANVSLDGDQPWDIRVTNPRFYSHVLLNGSVGLGESYMRGWWECEALAQLFARLSKINPDPIPNLGRVLVKAQHALFNMQTLTRAPAVAEAHYNLSNQMFQLMLDPYMQYSCGYWANATTLAEAQIAKMDMICRKLNIGAGDSVLEIGSGWGGFAKYASSHYGCKVTCYNISSAQVEFSREFCKGLPIEIIQEDYRKITGTYDKVVSIGMFEAVGPKNYAAFMNTVARSLKNDGLFLLHTIGANFFRPHANRWILKYIFPNGYVPTAAQINTSMEGRFVLEDWHNIGPDYYRTLMAWAQRFTEHWPEIAQLDGKPDEQFYRMWHYYLQSCAGAFASRELNLWQIVMSKACIGSQYFRPSIT